MVKAREFIVGEKFYRWEVVGEVFYKERPNGILQRYVPCKCECGTESEIACQALTSPSMPSKSCGCLKSEVMSEIKRTHGMRGTDKTRHGAHISWGAMKTRCTNKNTKVYQSYGAKGIIFDPKWETFEGFWEDMEEGWFEGSDIDRVDYRGNYCKENCRWADKSVSSHNKSKGGVCTSSYKGVHYDKQHDKWVAKLTRNGKTLFHKRFVNEEDAARAYDDASEKFYGDRPNEKYFNLGEAH
ncbi:AP2 domain protein [compost metagenome]